MTALPMADAFCAEASAEAGEGLFGSAAADTEVWLCLEYDRTWAPKPLGPSELPDPVKARIEGWLADVPKSRHQFIRRRDVPKGAPWTFLLGCARPRDPWMLRFELGAYEALLDLDLRAILAAGAHPDAARVEHPVHLVCTHGKRDRCCAKWGVPVHDALVRVAPEETWHTTHLGGHRFAANVTSFPFGVSYGRLGPDEMPAFAEAHRRGELHDLGRLRGRSCYPAPAQAAEYFLRRDSGDTRLDGYELGGVAAQDGGVRVSFRLEGGETRTVTVAEEPTGSVRPKSCGDEAVGATRYRLT